MIRRPKIAGEHRKIAPLLRREFGITLDEYLLMTDDEVDMYIEFLEMINKNTDKTRTEYKEILENTLNNFKELRKRDIEMLKMSKEDLKKLKRI